VTSLAWSSRFRVHHRIARRYRQGRLFLVGDAAHVHSPAGGQGMNTGIVDAVVLGELLADVVTGVRAETELDLYEAPRREAAEEVLGLAGTMTRMALVRNPVRRLLRNTALAIANRIPAARQRIQMRLSGLSRARLAQLPPPAAPTAPAAIDSVEFRRAA
jgi:2-polyprenyl-6-methoxyphenol hydroxylase-like FAD-dependent oxidoreductase